MSITYSDLAQNCRAAERVWTFSKRVHNMAIRKNHESDECCQTKILAILYCTMAEAYFLKILHTPGMLSPDEIDGVVGECKREGAAKAWKKLVECALRKVNAQRSGHVSNVQQKLNSLIDEFLVDPSIIRNKIAHGQWNTAFNRENTDVNVDISGKLNSLNASRIELHKDVLILIVQIVTDIVQSPNKAHMRDYWMLIQKLETKIEERKNWNVSTKRPHLLKGGNSH